jgi:hypothetical protein
MTRAGFQLDGLTQARSAAMLALCVVLAGSSLAAQSTGTKETPPPVLPHQTAESNMTASSPSSDAGGVMLDRVVAIVNGDLVLDSDVDEERRFAAFEPYRAPATEFSREKAIERLINRDLILQQIKLQPEDQVADADVTKQIDKLRQTIPACKQYHCETKEGWDRFLKDQGFTEASLFARWKQRMEMLLFIEERFRMGVTITPDQIKDYYDKTLLPEYGGQHATPPKLEAISSQIQQVLLQQKVTSLLDDWLKSLRAQGNVVVLHPGEEAP